jgi:signal peptidase II
VIVMAAVALDQVTKWWAESALDNGRVINVLPTLEFDLSYNSGFSFGTGSGFGPWIG